MNSPKHYNHCFAISNTRQGDFLKGEVTSLYASEDELL